MNNITKFCPKCKKDILVEFFTKNKNTRDGLSVYCRECHRKRSNERYKEDPERQKAKQASYRQRHPDRALSSDLKIKYGITLEEYENILKSQNGVCAACGKPPEKKRLSVDHNHKTGAIRALLCNDCNLALGHARDSVEVLSGLIAYLRRF